MKINKYFLLLGLSLFVACGTPAQPPVVPPIVPPTGQSTVTLTTSDSNPVVGSSVTFTATATGQITKLELLEGTTVLETVDDAATLETAVPMGAVGKRSFTARATDAAGVVATSAVVEVDTKAAGVGAAEITASLGASNLNPFLGASVKFSAAALPADQIKKLELLAGTTVLKTVDDTASFELNVVMDSAGAKSFTTRATSKSGVVVSSAELNVVVKEAVTLTASTLKPFEGGEVTFTVTSLLGQFASAKLELVEQRVVFGNQIIEVVVATKTSSPLTHVLVTDVVGTRKFFARLTNRTGQVFKSNILDVVTGNPPQVAMGSDHTCVLLINGDVRCWGKNDQGQLGLGNTGTLGDDEPVISVSPVRFPVGFRVKQIAAGSFHTCALSDEGKVICWGENSSGELGQGDRVNRGGTPETTPDRLDFVDISPVKQIISGVSSKHTCAILESNAVKCWGLNASGQLGLGNKTNLGDNPSEISQTAPIDLGTSLVKQFSVSGRTSCALLEDKTLHCWGNNSFGQLGYGNTSDFGDEIGEKPISKRVEISNVTQISVGNVHTCALISTGKVHCWGASNTGQLGYGNGATVGDNELPETEGFVEIGADVKQISAGVTQTCVLQKDHQVRCWGNGDSGQLGYGNTNTIGLLEKPNSVAPVQVNTDNTQGKIIKVFSGSSRTCVLFESANIKCWGINGAGQLGYGNRTFIGNDELPSSVGVVPLF
jgi:alpha-tubulin suppressor-like RCC1 family protein